MNDDIASAEYFLRAMNQCGDRVIGITVPNLDVKLIPTHTRFRKILSDDAEEVPLHTVDPSLALELRVLLTDDKPIYTPLH